jgi:hypothetical protein
MERTSRACMSIDQDLGKFFEILSGAQVCAESKKLKRFGKNYDENKLKEGDIFYYFSFDLYKLVYNSLDNRDGFDPELFRDKTILRIPLEEDNSIIKESYKNLKDTLEISIPSFDKNRLFFQEGFNSVSLFTFDFDSKDNISIPEVILIFNKLKKIFDINDPIFFGNPLVDKVFSSKSFLCLFLLNIDQNLVSFRDKLEQIKKKEIESEFLVISLKNKHFDKSL